MPRPDTIGSPMQDNTISSTPTSTGGFKAVDKIIGSSVIKRNTVVSKDTAIATEKFSSPNIVQPSIQSIPVTTGGAIFTPSAEELQAMTAQAPDSGTNTVTDTVNNAVSTAKSNPIIMYAAIGLGAFLIYKYFIK